jgi:NAD(P)-dependent dehydrogenase (short-subunit alcohol dehydrogenase family)
MTADDVVVITGGAGGMGQACARAVPGRVLLLDIAADPLEKAAAALAADGIEVVTARCDVTSPAEVAAVAARVRDLGRFRALVHTAGISPTMADGRRILEVDLVGTVHVTDALFPLVGPGSSAVLIGSIAGYSDVAPAVEKLLDDPLADDFFAAVEAALDTPLDTPLDRATAYVLAKRGVMRLAERLALPWGKAGGRVVSIAPGLIDTAMGRMELETQPIAKVMAEITPVQRPGGPLPGRVEDIAAAVAFLISDDAGFISGCDIRVDGGLMGAGKHLAGG